MTQIVYFTYPAEIEKFSHSHSEEISNVGVRCLFCGMEQYKEMVMSAPDFEITCQYCGEMSPVGTIIPDPTKDFWINSGIGFRVHLN